MLDCHGKKAFTLFKVLNTHRGGLFRGRWGGLLRGVLWVGYMRGGGGVVGGMCSGWRAHVAVQWSHLFTERGECTVTWTSQL